MKHVHPKSDCGHEAQDTVPEVAEARRMFKEDSSRDLEFMEALCAHVNRPEYREEFIARAELLAEYANVHFFIPRQVPLHEFQRAPRLVRLLLKQRRFEVCYGGRQHYSDIAYEVITLVRPLLKCGWTRGLIWTQLTIQRSLLLTWYPKKGQKALTDLHIAAERIARAGSGSVRSTQYRSVAYVFWRHGKRLSSLWYLLKSIGTSRA